MDGVGIPAMLTSLTALSAKNRGLIIGPNPSLIETGLPNLKLPARAIIFAYFCASFTAFARASFLSFSGSSIVKLGPDMVFAPL